MKKIKIIPLLLILSLCYCMPNTLQALDSTDINYFFPAEESKTISMDFKNASLNDVLKIFSQQSGMNFISSFDVAGRSINLYLDNVPVEDALERILSANSLTYEIKPGTNIFVVKELLQSPINLITRVYRLRYATVPSSKLNSTFSATASASGGSSGATGSAGATGESAGATGSTGLMEAVSALLSENGSLVEDSRTNSIIVTDIPTQFPRIEQTIARLDVRVPLILIEVEMLDISKATADLLGAKFGKTPFTFRGASKQNFFPFDTRTILQGELGLAAQYTAATQSFSGLSITLQFLKTQTDTKSLARPRIITLNNETAEIKIETNEAIGINTTITSTEGTAQTTVEAEREITGVSLTVTPQANIETGEIILALQPRVKITRASAFSDDIRDPEEQVTKTILRVMDGDTVMLGGLLRTDKNEVTTRVPILSRIPLFGAAFRHKNTTSSQRELIVFISPHIIKEQLVSRLIQHKGRALIREQDIPVRRSNEIDKELSYFEKQRY